MADAEFAQLIQRLYTKVPPPNCMYVAPDGRQCRNAAISSHSLQKSITLKTIAERGHVYRLGMNPLDFKRRGRISAMKVGLRKASVFPGFCKRHDQELFRDIETGESALDKRVAALIGYRVICMEIYLKEQNLRMFSDDEVRNRAKRLGVLDDIEAFYRGSALAHTDLMRIRAYYDQCLHKNKYENFNAIMFEFSETLPFCFAAPFAPEFDFHGAHLLPDVYEEWDSVAAFAGRLGNKNVFLISGFHRGRIHDIARFIKSFSSAERSIIGDVALQIALDYAENSFYRISWFENLGETTKYSLISQFSRVVPGQPDEYKENLAKPPALVNISAERRPLLIEAP